MNSIILGNFKRGFKSVFSPKLGFFLTTSDRLILNSRSISLNLPRFYNSASCIPLKTIRFMSSHSGPIFFCAGSGSDFFSDATAAGQVLSLLGSSDTTNISTSNGILSETEISLVYIGTPSYDCCAARDRQCRGFLNSTAATVKLSELKLVYDSDYKAVVGGFEGAKTLLEAADIILVSGGNTLFAVDRWRKLGVDEIIAGLMSNQNQSTKTQILCGGSAGAICWFASGHSDSADPDTYLSRKERYVMRGVESSLLTHQDESSAAPTSLADRKEWKYIRVPGLDMIPGNLLCVPHADRVQSNGVLRELDYEEMALRRAATNNSNFKSDSDNDSECALGIDHWAALIVWKESGNAPRYKYRVFSVEGKTRGPTVKPVVDNVLPLSVSPLPSPVTTNSESDLPGIWIKTVVLNLNGALEVVTRRPPREGDFLKDILGAKEGVTVVRKCESFPEDEACERCRVENPDPNTTSIL